uniref:AA_permease domain-containing protein n=1 Tax=Globodera pallida TaxID=36090 RepID=A0A183C456_GLOPA
MSTKEEPTDRHQQEGPSSKLLQRQRSKDEGDGVSTGDVDTGQGLAKSLTLMNGVSMIVGCIIGSGIFLSPTGVQRGLGSYCYAELGTLIKKSGGDYAYIMEAFGPFPAFMRLWVEAFVVRPCTCTIVAITFANHRILSSDPGANFNEMFKNTNTDVAQVSIAFYSGLFAYQGWNYLNFIVEELQNPKRNLPLAILISTVSVTVIYVLTNVALYVVISPQEMLGSEAVAVEFANKMYGPFAFTMPLFVACSTLGIFTSSRLFYVGAREEQMPIVLTMINKQTRTPVPAIVFLGLLSLIYLAFSNDALKLINYIAISYWLAIGAAIASLFYFRKKMPNASRPIKVNLIFPAFFLLGCIALVIVPIIANPKDTAIGIAIMLSSVPVYLIFICWKNKPTFFNRASGL